MKGGKRLFALRGATQCRNDPEDIAVQVTALYEELLRENKLAEGDILSLVFSMTEDLDIKNPAAALRQAGYARDLALFVVQEARIKNSPKGLIRVLLHCYLDEGADPRHIYRNGAEVLRPDWSSKGSGEVPAPHLSGLT
ncbi:MAG: chorismate mutase [Treponema sp.]|nr:chorismate mutase [Treponema sp.]